MSDGLPVATHRLAPARLRALRTALVHARFGTLERTYESDRPIADGFVYRVTYGGRTVQIEEGATLPARLQRPFTLLMRLVSD